MSGVSLSHLLPPLPGFTALASTYAPGRSGAAPSPTPSGSCPWPRRPPCASGTGPATSTEARTSLGATVAPSVPPASPCCTR